MTTTAAIICEYNPFHRGHACQIRRIREEFGSDTRIIALMSGNYVQRGLPAMTDKFTRAEAAVRCGVDLVLSFPFPYCVSGADYFARHAVSLIAALGIADVLSFGCESEDADLLMRVAAYLGTTEYEHSLKESLSSRENNRSFAEAREAVLCARFPEATSAFLRAPNNTLALSYLAALSHTDLRPHFVVRAVPHHAETIVDGVTSASHIRALISEGRTEEAFSALPSACADLLRDRLSSGAVITDDAMFSSFVLSSLRLHGFSDDVFESSKDLRARILRRLMAVSCYSDLVRLSVSPTYSAARVRRAILHACFGISAECGRGSPAFTQVLAMNEVGRQMLKEIKSCGRLEVLTKPADARLLSQTASEQASREAAADSVYSCFFPKGKVSGDAFLRKSPFCL